MEMMRLQARGEVTVTSEGLLQIVRTHFNRISPAEWAMLANGTCDVETTNVLLSMFVQLIQTLSANVLRLVIPRDEVRVRCLSEDEANRAFQTITTVLQQSVGLMFGQALNVPLTQTVDLSNESQELTVLLENEVSQNVNSILSTGSQDSLERVLNVPLKMPSVQTSRDMLDRAKKCLKMCLNVMTCSCAKPEKRARSAGSVDERKNGPCYPCFNVFARKNFKKMQESIESQIMMEVSSASPSSAAGSPPGGAASPAGSPSLSPLRTPEKEFNEIQQDVDDIFRQMNMGPCSGSRAGQRRVNDYLQSKDMKRLLDKLVNIMFCHFHVYDLCRKQAARTGQAGSQSALLFDMGQTTGSHFTVLSTFVQGQVRKFIKNLCNFTQQDSLDYLNNVDLYEICMEQRSFNSQRYDIFQQSMTHPKACVPSNVSADVPAIVLRTPPEETSPKAESSPKAKSSLKTESSPKTVSAQTPQEATALTEGQFMTQTVVLELTRKIYKNVPLPEREEDSYRPFADRLTQKAQEEIDLQGWQCRKLKKNLNNVVKGVMQSLNREYGKPKRVCEALLMDTEAFEATVMKYLQIHIDLELHKKPSLWSRVCTFICCCS